MKGYASLHHIINVLFQNDRKHEHMSFLLFISIRRVQKYLSVKHMSKKRKPPGRDCCIF